jgi:hypothetical protein
MQCIHDSELIDWKDCSKAGHEVECYVATCSKCKHSLKDCEDQRKDK